MTKKGKKHYIYGILVLVLFLAMLFIDENIEKNVGEICVPFILASKSIFLLVIGFFSMILTGLMCPQKFIKQDTLKSLLFIRIVWFTVTNITLIGFFRMTGEFKPGIVLSYILSYIFFCVGSTIPSKKIVVNVLCFAIFVIFFQMLYTFAYRNMSFSNPQHIKWWMNIPIGQTNTIACYLIGMLIYTTTYFHMKNKYFSLAIIYVLTFLCILMTYSRAGLIIYIIYILYRMVMHIKTKGINTYLKWIIGFVILCLVAFAVYQMNPERFSLHNMSYTRMFVYAQSFLIFTDNILIGIGAHDYHVYDAYKAHNWILETLVQNGIIGSIIFFMSLIVAYKKIKKHSRPFLLFFVFYLMHGLIEPNLYSAQFDSFFWLLVGTCCYGQYENGKKRNSNGVKQWNMFAKKISVRGVWHV